ncbi:MAG: 23S rRNA (uracil(1939)-C(5))-methyltransferase RlmD [Chitinophagaceae bacterium]|nr:MAG: 23S rRNA (uracil(1939)-C(5))-methyltransferase RlmD [Chitinophagaceae bacterium]
MRKKKNIVLERVTVENYAAEGKSIARVEGKVIFIEEAVPGDVVDIRLGKNKKEWAEGRPIFFHSYSADRVKPFCEHFGVCGGCQWQMLPYEKQLAFKQQQVFDNLTRIGKIPLPPFEPITGASPATHYRNKVEYTFSNRRYLTKNEVHDETISSQADVAGYHAKGLFDKVVDIRECHLQHEPTNAIRNAVKKFALENEYSFYDIREHRGLLRTMQVRLCRSGELMLNVVFGENDKEKIMRLLDFIMAQFPAITTLLYTINLKKNDSMFDLEPVVYSGKGYVIETLENYRFKIGPKSFFQTNTYQGEKLYQVAREYAELTGQETVYDLYCGTGSIGIFVSDKAKSIVGVEVIKEAVDDAVENALINGVEHAKFFAGDVSKICNDGFIAEHGRPDVIITDPPRAGMSPDLVNKIIEMAPPLVVYVSCNPATQARDLNMMKDHYEVTRIRPVDMFPHTHHIENVVQLRLK